MAALLSVIQWLNVIGLMSILVIAGALYRKWYETRYILLPPVRWAVFGLVFYGLVLGGVLSADAVLVWGAIHRMLAVAMVFGGLVTLWVILDEDDYHGGDDEF